MYAQSSLLLCKTSQSRLGVDLKLVNLGSSWKELAETFHLAGFKSSRKRSTASELEHLDGRCRKNTQSRQLLGVDRWWAFGDNLSSCPFGSVAVWELYCTAAKS